MAVWFHHHTAMKTPAIVLFDWDNTLSDTFPALFDSYNHMLRHFEMDEWDEATAKANIRHVAHEYLPTLLGERWEEGLEIYRGYYRENHAVSPAFESALELMQKLREKGIRVGVISNKNEGILKVAANASPFAQYLEVVFGAVNERPGKPDPAVMDMALKALNYDGPMDDVWYVGDTDVDMEFAANCGAKSVFIENAGLDTLEDIKIRHKPDMAFYSLKEFLSYLD